MTFPAPRGEAGEGSKRNHRADLGTGRGGLKYPRGQSGFRGGALTFLSGVSERGGVWNGEEWGQGGASN